MVRKLVNDTSSANWTDTQVDEGINAAIRQAGPLGEHGFGYATQAEYAWRYEMDYTASPSLHDLEAVTDVWVQLTEIDGVQISRLPRDQWEIAIKEGERYVFAPFVAVSPEGYTHSLIVRYRLLPTDLTDTGSTTIVNPQWITYQAASHLCSQKAAGCEVNESSRWQRLAQWHYMQADALAERLLGIERTDKPSEIVEVGEQWQQ